MLGDGSQDDRGEGGRDTGEGSESEEHGRLVSLDLFRGDDAPSSALKGSAWAGNRVSSTILETDETNGSDGSDDGNDPAMTKEEVELASEVVEVMNKSKSWKRWVVLVLATAVIWGAYYAFDNPGATQLQLRKHFGIPTMTGANSTSAQNATVADFNIKYNLLYSVYSLPNTVLPLVGGALVDRIGFRRMTVYTAALAMVGQALFAVGTGQRLWWLMWVGRGVFGIGTESMAVAQRILVAEWFFGTELAFSMGLVLSFGRLASTVNDNISALFWDPTIAYYIGLALCAVSVVCAMVVTHMDAQHELQAKAIVSKQAWQAFEKSRTSKPPTSLAACGQLTRPFWVYAVMSVVLFPPVSSFNAVGTQELKQRFMQAGESSSVKRVNLTLGWMYVTAAVMALVAGWVVDRLGHRPLFIAGAAVLMGGSHLVLGLTMEVLAPIVGIGLGFAFVAAAFWPSIAYVVPADSLGLAYGVVGAFQNTGLAAGPAIAATLQPPACNGTFLCVEYFFAGLALTGAVLGVIAFMEERKLQSETESDALVGEESSRNLQIAPPTPPPTTSSSSSSAASSSTSSSVRMRKGESIVSYIRRVRISSHQSSAGGVAGGDHAQHRSMIEALRVHADETDGDTAEQLLERDDEDDEDDENMVEADVWAYVGSGIRGNPSVAAARMSRLSSS